MNFKQLSAVVHMKLVLKFAMISLSIHRVTATDREPNNMQRRETISENPLYDPDIHANIAITIFSLFAFTHIHDSRSIESTKLFLVYVLTLPVNCIILNTV